MRVVGPDEHPTEVPRVQEVQYVEQSIYVQSIYVWLYYFSTCTYYYPRNASVARTLYTDIALIFDFQDGPRVPVQEVKWLDFVDVGARHP